MLLLRVDTTVSVCSFLLYLATSSSLCSIWFILFIIASSSLVSMSTAWTSLPYLICLIHDGKKEKTGERLSSMKTPLLETPKRTVLMEIYSEELDPTISTGCGKC
jgi:hypothetical protein